MDLSLLRLSDLTVIAMHGNVVPAVDSGHLPGVHETASSTNDGVVTVHAITPFDAPRRIIH